MRPVLMEVRIEEASGVESEGRFLGVMGEKASPLPPFEREAK